MSGTNTTTAQAYGPRRSSRLELMGIRFVNENEGGENNNAGGSGENNQWTPPASQEDLNRIIADRLSRERDKFKDYDALKTKADQFDRLQQSGTGTGHPADVTAQLQQFEQRVTAAETSASQTQEELTKTQTELARKDVAITKGIGKEQLPLLTATTKEELEKQADAILALTRGSGRVPGQGGGGGDAPSGLDAGRAEWEKRHPKKN